MEQLSFLGNADIGSIETLYNQYKQDPQSVDSQWRIFFSGFELALLRQPEAEAAGGGLMDKEFAVINLINDYRRRGHLFTKTNPVRSRRTYTPTLAIENFGLTQADLNTPFRAGSEIGIGTASLQAIIDHLTDTYCQSVGVEYMYMRNTERVQWLRNKMELNRNQRSFSNNEKLALYHGLKKAAGFERFIHKKFVGQKRFSLEGTEALIPALHQLLTKGSELGIGEVVFAMAHRGRLNVLTNVLEKPYANVFKEFNGNEYEENIILGDVKYHLGYDNKLTTESGKPMYVSLVPNPSHLETVSGIVQGITQALAIGRHKSDFNHILPVVIHGDAAIAAQGVVYETVQMSGLPGYGNGGSLHVVINNQVGFTTNYLEARTSTYCTDIAKVIHAPVFHVNGDDVEALVYTIELALEYRQTFHTDVFIDILSYRKYGHNEGDDPRFTQPLLYQIIANHPGPRDIYSVKLLAESILTAEQAAEFEKAFDDELEQAFAQSLTIDKVYIKQYLSDLCTSFRYSKPADFEQSPETGVKRATLKRIAKQLNTLPTDKPFFNKIHKLTDDRAKMVAEDRLDWALGELLAYGSLVLEGIPVRLSGQDTTRGTFSHRHAGHVIEDTDQKYFPLQQLDPKQAAFTVLNSPLSEYGVMGFEYGYSLAMPTGLTIWEAQFGDFFNVAQVIVDQYISSAEEKWGLMNGLTLFLPHGFEGQGPEHSSGRIERFLTLCANNNMQVVNCTTPANVFHLLRRQVKRNIRLPLVLFTPKSLLRHPRCVSPLSDFETGGFREITSDASVQASEVTRVVFCSGKIYYDLLERREQLKASDVALVRIEQLYPFPKTQVEQVLARYPNALLHLWVQEEPENMGAWNFVRKQFSSDVLIPVTRQASGSPAVGLHELHKREQDEIMGKVFRPCSCERKLKYCGLQCVEGKSRIEILKQFEYLFEGIELPKASEKLK